MRVAPSRFAVLLLLFACANAIAARGKYASIGPLKMYYEIHGPADAKSPPLVLIHGGGSTIETSFGAVLPALAVGRQVIAVEEQAHGHTADVPGRPHSFEQTADDVAELLRQLKIERADVCGFSNGGSSALQVAIRHPTLVHKVVAISAATKRSGFYPQFWESIPKATLNDMPAELREAFEKINPDPAALLAMFERDKARMLDFKDWPDESLREIKSPTLLVAGDHDVVRPEHAVEIFRLVPSAQLAIVPGADHETIVKNGPRLVSILVPFLDAPMSGDHK